MAATFDGSTTSMYPDPATDIPEGGVGSGSSGRNAAHSTLLLPPEAKIVGKGRLSSDASMTGSQPLGSQAGEKRGHVGT